MFLIHEDLYLKYLVQIATGIATRKQEAPEVTIREAKSILDAALKESDVQYTSSEEC